MREALVAVAVGFLTELPDKAKIVTAATSLIAMGFTAGSLGAASMFTAKFEVIEARTDSTVTKAAQLTRDMRTLEARIRRAEEQDSARFEKLLCVLTDGRDLSGAAMSRACGL